MKSFKKIFIWLCIVVLLWVIGAAIFVKLYGKGMVHSVLQSLIKKEVVIESLDYHFPLGLRAFGVRLDKNFYVREVIVQFKFSSIFLRQLNIAKIIFIEPNLVIERVKKSEDELNVAQAADDSLIDNPKSPVPEVKKSSGREATIGRIVVKNGKIDYFNKGFKRNFSFKLKDVQLESTRFIFPLRAMATRVKFSARFADERLAFLESYLEGAGWLDMVNKDMEATLKLVGLDRKIESTAQMISQKNHMTVSGSLKIKKVPQGKKEDTKSQEAPSLSRPDDMIAQMLSSVDIDVDAKFSFETKMDDFQWGDISFSGTFGVKDFNFQ